MSLQVKAEDIYVNRNSLSSRVHCCQYWGVKREVARCELHPLIYTFPSGNSAQDVEKKKAEPKTPHFLGLDQDIVAWPQEEKCRLKYVIHISGSPALG